MIADLDMPRKARAIGKHRMIGDMAIMGDMHIGHEQIIVAYARHPATAGGAAMDRALLPKHVTVADFEQRALAAEPQVLRHLT